MTKRFGGSVLIFEALVIILAIPVAINVAGAPVTASLASGLLLALAAVLVAARLDRPWAVTAGWVLQGLVIATALVIPIMAVLGVIFAVLWLAALRLARLADEEQSAATGDADDEELPAGPDAVDRGAERVVEQGVTEDR